MPVFWREIARTRISLLAWTISMIALSVALMAFFPTIQTQAEELDAMFARYPPEFKELFQLDRLSMADPLGYYATENHLFLTLFGGIYAMMLAVGALAREESERTSEFLLTRPYGRARVVTAKTLASFACLVVFDLLIGLATYVLFEVVAGGEYDRSILMLLILGAFLLHLFLWGIGLLVSVFVVKARSFYPLSIGVVLTLYFLGIWSLLDDKAEPVRYLTPFRYIDPAEIIEEGRIAPLSFLLIGSVVVVCIALTHFFYRRKDIAG